MRELRGRVDRRVAAGIAAAMSCTVMPGADFTGHLDDDGDAVKLSGQSGHAYVFGQDDDGRLSPGIDANASPDHALNLEQPVCIGFLGFDGPIETRRIDRPLCDGRRISRKGKRGSPRQDKRNK